MHVLDPRERLDARLDVLVRDGQIAELGEPGALSTQARARSSKAPGATSCRRSSTRTCTCAPPARSTRRISTRGTRAAAAGGYGGVIAMPNTDPVIDSAPLLRSLRDGAAREALVPVGFLAAITRGLDGEELTEMAELAEQGALGFTDDGRPVQSAGVLRKALQYQRLSGGVICLHEEDPTLSRSGCMREGAVSAALGIAGIPSVSESTMVARDAELARYEHARVHFQHLSCVASVQTRRPRQGRAGARVSAEVTPAPPAAHRRGRARPGHADEDEPAAGERERPHGARARGCATGTIDCVATDHAPHAREEKEVPFEQAPMGTTGLETAFAALHTGLVLTGELTLSLLVERMSAGAALFGLPAPRIARGEPANLDAARPRRELGRRRARLAEPLARAAALPGAALTGRVALTIADGAVAYRERALAAVAS